MKLFNNEDNSKLVDAINKINKTKQEIDTLAWWNNKDNREMYEKEKKSMTKN